MVPGQHILEFYHSGKKLKPINPAESSSSLSHGNKNNKIKFRNIDNLTTCVAFCAHIESFSSQRRHVIIIVISVECKYSVDKKQVQNTRCSGGAGGDCTWQGWRGGGGRVGVVSTQHTNTAQQQRGFKLRFKPGQPHPHWSGGRTQNRGG